VVGQVKYLGGITFLLSDGCPEKAEQAAISQYFQCIQTEKLHVSQVINKFCNLFSYNWNLQCKYLCKSSIIKFIYFNVVDPE
jgi:hypothetical protein